MDLLAEPITRQTSQAFDSLEENPQIVNYDNIQKYMDVVDETAENFVKNLHQGYEVERIAALLKKCAMGEETGANEAVEIGVDSSLSGEAAPFSEETATTRDAIKYKIQDYDLIFGPRGTIKIEIAVEINDTLEKTTAELPLEETISKLITEEGRAIIIGSIKDELDAFWGTAPYILGGPIQAKEEANDFAEEPLSDTVMSGKFYFRLYEIDTKTLLQNNS